MATPSADESNSFHDFAPRLWQASPQLLRRSRVALRMLSSRSNPASCRSAAELVKRHGSAAALAMSARPAISAVALLTQGRPPVATSPTRSDESPRMSRIRSIAVSRSPETDLVRPTPIRRRAVHELAVNHQTGHYDESVLQPCYGKALVLCLHS